MSERFPAAVMRATPVVPSPSSAPGVWTMEQQLQAQAQGIWPVNPDVADPYFENVSLLLHGDGTNGAQNNTFLNTPPSGVGSYAGYFDGAGDYLTVLTGSSIAFGTGDFTVEFWLYFVAADADFDLFVATNTMNIGYYKAQNWGLTYNNGIGGFPAAYKIQSLATPTFNAWSHIACCRVGGVTRLFLNGTVVGTYSGDTTDYAAGNTTVGNSGYSPNAYISNVRILKGVGLYSGTFTPPTAPLTAITGTSLLTCQNATFVDNSPNAFAVTASGNAAMVNSGAVPAITRNGNTTQGSFSPFGTLWSNYFDGTGDYLIPAANGAFALGTGDFTIEGWFFPASASATQGIMGCGPGSANSWQVFANLTAGKVTFNVYGGTAYVSTNSFTVNTWNHFAIVRSGGTIKVYLNGVGNTGVSNATNFTVTNLVIGRSYYNLSQEHFQGNVSNVRIVKSAVYSGNFTPPASPLTAISDTVLLTCQSNGFVDNSATGAVITRNGDVAVSRFSPFAPTTPYDTSVIGGSGYFDGTGDYLNAGGNAAFAFGTGDFTIEMWVNFNSTATQTLFDTRPSGTPSTVGYQALTYISGAINYYTAGVTAITGTTVPAGAWTHVALCKSGTSTKLFINGTQAGSTYTDTQTYAVGANRPVIGVDGNALNSSYMNGYISNFRMLKGTALYTSAFTPPAAPLSAIANTSLLLSMTNGAIFDNAMMCDLETVGNAQISTSVKKYGTGALYFDGSGDYLQMASNSALILGAGSATVEFWVYPLAVDGYRRLVTSTSGGFTSGDFVIRYNNGTFLAGSGNLNINSGTLPAANQWSHVAWVGVGGTAQTLYINGVSVGTAGAYSLTVPIQFVGGWYTLNTTEFFNGYIDDLRITKGVARYTGNFTPPAAAFNNQ